MAETTTKERPILFSGEMVRAILEGRKTQTRRIIYRVAGFGPVTEVCKSEVPGYGWSFRDRRMLWNDVTVLDFVECCPAGRVGDRLWVRETFGLLSPDYEPLHGQADILRADWGDRLNVTYQADHIDPTGDGPANPMSWRPSIHMPRWASRVDLEITDVRAERLNDISDEDIEAEGIWHDGDYFRSVKHPVKGTDKCWPSAAVAFEKLWDSINGEKAPWASNSWVWVIQFKRLDSDAAVLAKQIRGQG